MTFIEEKMENRVKPDFGSDVQSYFQRVIDEEKGYSVSCYAARIKLSLEDMKMRMMH